MAIPYQTVKFKSANIFFFIIMVIWGTNTKFNTCQVYKDNSPTP